MQKSQEYLRFGQIIRIHGHKCLQNEPNKQDANQIQESMKMKSKQSEVEIRGMIAVKGFTDKDAKYLTFQHFKNCQFYRQTLFQILPRGYFEKCDNPEQQNKKKALYEQLCAQRMGEYVKFGEDVVFRHVDSLDYLSGSVRCSDGGLGAFRVQLSDKLLINLVFKLYPFRSFQKQGDKIKLQSPLRIKNIENRCYFSTQKNQNKYSIVTTYSQSFTWLIHLHQSHQTLSDIDQIRTHDILFLRHTKNDGYLCLEKKRGQKENQIQIIPCVKLPVQQTGYHCFTCLWEVQKFSVPKISPYFQQDKAHLGTEGTYSLRQLLTGAYLEITKVKQSKEGKQVTSVHLIQNQQPNYEITIKSAKGLPNVSDYLKHNGLIKIGGPKSGRQDQIDAAQQIKTASDILRYRQKSPYKVNQVKKSEAQSQHGFRIIKIDEQSKRQVLLILSTYEVLDQFALLLKKDTFTFNKQVKSKKIDMIDLTLQKLIAFIKNCSIKDIELDVLPVKKRQFICMDLQICQKLFDILHQMGIKILQQIYKTLKVENQAFKTTFNRAYYLILQIIKNNPITKLYVCQSWLDIILDHAIQNQQERVHQTLNQILQSNQLVVTKFLKANNNHLVQRIIDIFTLKPPHQKFLNIFRASCMSNGAPMVGNQKLILTYFFKQLDQVSKFKFLTSVNRDNLQRRIGENPSNQQEVLQPQIQQIFIECYISKDHLEKRPLKKFFEDSSRLDLSQTSNYFISYLNLLADICYGRNTQAKKYVEEILVPTNTVGVGEEGEGQVLFTSLDTLISILQDEGIKTVRGSNNLLRAVIRLINYAYVVSADQNPVLRINRYRNLDNMQKQKVIVGQKFKKVMKFIKDKLSNFESFFSIVINENDPDKKQKQIISLQQKDLMLTVLELLKSSLVIGYWTVKQQQNQLFPLLLKILSNQKKDILHHKENIPGSQQLKQFEKFKNQVSQSTLSVQLIKNCKALACQLIEIIFDFRHDNLVTQCVLFYKEKGSEEQRSILQQPGGSIQLNLANTTSNVKVHPLYDPQLWKAKMQQIFKEPTDQQSRQVRQATKNMNPLMVQLSIHKDPILFFRSLKIMKRHFEYRNDIMKLFLSLSIYDNDNGVQLAQQINQKRKILGKLQEENLLYSSQNGVYDDIMAFLVWLSESIKQGANLSLRPNFKDYVNIFNHFNQQSRINKFHQRLIKNKDLHPIMLNFIGLSKQPICDFKGDSRLVLKYVYRFLSLLAKSFSEAKSQMIHMKQKIFDHVMQQCQNITIKHDPQKRKKGHQDLQYQLQNDNIDMDLASHRLNMGEVRQQDVINLQMRDDCEAITLLAELFSHNKYIIYNQVLMEQVSIDVSEMVNTCPIQNYYKSHLLDFFRTMIYYKDRHIKTNQARILAKLQDSKKKNIYYRFDKSNPKGPALTPEYLSDLIEKWQHMNKDLLRIRQPGQPYPLKKHEQQTVIILPQLTYNITMLNLFANLVQGKHDVNIGKCRQVHRYVDLMKILKNSSICYPLKTHLRHYINQLYYSTKIEEDLCAQIIRQQIPLIIEDLNTLIVILVKQRQGKYKLVHPVRFKYFDTYVYLYIEQIIYSLNYLQSDQTFIDILMRQLRDDFGNGFFYLHYYIMRIYQRLRWLLNYFYGHKYIRGFLNKVTNQMKNIFLKDFQKNMFKTFDRNQQKMHDPADYKPGQKRPKKELNLNRQEALKKRSKDLLYKLVKAQIKQYFTVKRPQKDKNFPLTFVLPYGDEAQTPPQDIVQSVISKQDDLSLLAQKLRILFLSKQSSRQRKDYHHLKLKKLQDSLLTNPDFKVFMTFFKSSQCIELYKIDEFSNTHYKFNQKFVSLQEYIKNFVKVNTEQPDSISNDLKIFFFQVLLQYITQHKRKQLQKSVQQWQKDDWEECKDKIIDAQKFLSNADVAGLIIENLKTSDDIYLSAHVLLFGIAYLIGGNQICQNSILNKLKQDIKNDVFIKIQKLISRLGKKITTRIAQKTSHKEPYQGQFVVQALDEYDYYDEKIKAMKRAVTVQKTSKDEEEQQNIERAVFSRLFKFLQLLCECNNYELKHFVRVQTNTDGSKKNYSFNVINMTTFEIRRLFKVMCQQACKVVLPLTDFLNEVVTVPCTENQISLCQTTFFQDLCYMANTFNDSQIRRARKFDQPQSKKKLFQIYQKCILIILNVLQGNQAKLNRQLLIKLDVSFLLFVIKQNLKILNIYTKNDLKQLLYNVQIQKRKVPVQLENAINVMIVLKKLEDCEGSEKFKQKKANYLKQYARKPPSKKIRLGHQNQGQSEFNIKINLQELLVALGQQMLMIEVVSSKGYQKIYFPKHPILTKLSGATRDRIMADVSRSTQRQKIKSLFSYKEDIYTQIDHNFKIQKQKFLFGLLTYEPSTIARLQDYSFKVSYLVLFLWFVTTDIIVQHQQVIYFEPYFMRPILNFFNVLQLCITLAYFSSYKVCTYQISKFRARKQQQALLKQQQRLKPKEQQIVTQQKQGAQKQNQNKQKKPEGNVISNLFKSLSNWIGQKISASQLYVLLQYDQKFKYVLLYVITSLCGTFYSQSAYLVYIIWFFLQNQTLSNVFNAIIFNLKQLFSVSLLGIVFVYIFELIFFDIYALDMMSQKDPDEACDSIIGCIMDLYVSGTIGGSVQEFNFMRFGTDLIYFIFFGLLFGNIVSGIMIDTFAELRSKRQAMNDDKKNKCYICGKDRAQLQKANENFDDHIQKKHFLWNYIYYMYCLKQKNLTQFSGLEYEIKECIDKGQNDESYISWIPFSSQSGDEHGEKIQQLNKAMKQVNTESNTKITQLKSQSSKTTGQVEATQ